MEYVKVKELPTVLFHLNGNHQVEVINLRWADLDGKPHFGMKKEPCPSKYIPWHHAMAALNKSK